MTIPKTQRRVVLANRPAGEPSGQDFRVEEAPVPEPGPGQILVRAVYLSLDPYMRGRMRDVVSYAPVVQIGEVAGSRWRSSASCCRAISVACSKSFLAPVVCSPKISSSAIRPPNACPTRAIS